MKPRDRFFSEGQCYFGPRDNPTTETHCNVWDWDRLKMVKMKGTARLFPPDEDVEVSVLARLRRPHCERDMEMVLTIPEWVCKRELDSDVSSFRSILDDWVTTRKSDGELDRYFNAANRLTWPELPTVPDYDVPYELGKTADGEPIWTTGPRSRRTAMEKGQYCFCWERVPGLAEDNNDK